MTVQELLEAIDRSIIVKVESHDYDCFSTTPMKGCQSTYSLYYAIKNYIVMNISYIESNDINHQCYLFVDAWENEDRTNNGVIKK